MTKLQTKFIILAALNNYLGDDAYRARVAFKNCNPEQMQECYGASHHTRQEILDEVEEHEKKVKATIEWVKANL